jgi:tetratricopeptide (TPR) repeat protein
MGEAVRSRRGGGLELQGFLRNVCGQPTPWHLAFKRLGDYERAIADYTAALRLAPDNCGVYRNRSLAWKGLKAFDRAQADLLDGNEC